MYNKSIKIIICSGGTGGHIYPAISIADRLKIDLINKYKSIDFLFLGKNNGMEMEIVSKIGYKILGLSISSIPNKLSYDFLKFPFKIFNTYKKCLNIFNFYRPNIIIGTGGYISAIPIIIAYKNKIPIFIQEQNVYPGYTNKKLGFFLAKKIFVSYEKTLSFFPKKKVFFTGNPIRQKILLKYNKIDIYNLYKLNPNKPIILSLGGSLGAKSINDAWINNIQKIINEDIQIIWQTGNIDFFRIKNNILCQHNNIVLKKFIDNIHLAYSITNIIISRAGGSTISEISALGIPSILIPFPKSSKNHQLKNAKYILDNNAAFMIYDNELQTKLVDTTLYLLKNKNFQKKLSNNILKISKPFASKNISNEILKCL